MGIIPIGPADTLMITPAQIAMIVSLGAVFQIRVDENLAKSILGGLALSVAGRAVAAFYPGSRLADKRRYRRRAYRSDWLGCCGPFPRHKKEP
jgi:hypothetical protein